MNEKRFNMPKFLCNKLGRDKGLESFKAEGITPTFRLLAGLELQEALKRKLIEEAHEVQEATDKQALIAELADVLEVIDGLCAVYGICPQEIVSIKKKKYDERGGFGKGFYLETIDMDEGNSKIKHFRSSPEKYPEIKY
jgi:predicted house-cleaning noncanonical NTP pyrophosphatase (MazG superfamily)